ncbi:MAG: glycerophosphodiester phosphodiesterase family protein [Lachnospiraceae bacterium]|nr:glycerophosphodiester phosphodiesterase family protein [Lachnospiraceae bacterium]
MQDNTMPASGRTFRRGLRRETTVLYRRSRYALIGVEILYKILTMLVIMPLLRLFLSSTLKISAVKFLVNSPLDILKDPLYIIALIIAAIIVANWALLEIGLMVHGLHLIKNGESFTFISLLKLTWKDLRRSVQKGNRMILVAAALLIPFTNILLAGNYIKQIMVPEYIMDTILTKPLLFVLYAAGVAAAVFFALRWLFAFHFYFVKGETFAEARAHSIEILHGIRGLIHPFLETAIRKIVVYIKWGLLIGLLYLIICVVVMKLNNREITLAVSVMFPQIFKPLALYFLNILGIIIQFAVLSGFFYVRTEGTFVMPAVAAKAALRSRLFVPFCAVAGTAVCVLFAAALHYVPDEVITLLLAENTEITAHRGINHHAVENTLEAFDDAIKSGYADRIEMDVQMTKDGVVVINHDATLNRVAGIDKAICDMTYEEVAAVTLKGTDVNGQPVTGKIATLEEVLTLCKDRTTLNIETKPFAETPDLEAETVRIIKEFDMEDDVVITSLSYPSLSKIKEADPDMKTGFILALGVGMYYDLPDADFFSVESTFVSSRMINDIHMTGKTVSCWTVSDAETATELLNIGVDDIITNDPEMIYNTRLDYQASPLKFFAFIESLRSIFSGNIDEALKGWQEVVNQVIAVTFDEVSLSPINPSEILQNA